MSNRHQFVTDALTTLIHNHFGPVEISELPLQHINEIWDHISQCYRTHCEIWRQPCKRGSVRCWKWNVCASVCVCCMQRDTVDQIAVNASQTGFRVSDIEGGRRRLSQIFIDCVVEAAVETKQKERARLPFLSWQTWMDFYLTSTLQSEEIRRFKRGGGSFCVFCITEDIHGDQINI